MTDIEALRARMREAAEEAKAAGEAKPGDPDERDCWIALWGAFDEAATPDTFLALDAYTTRLREDLDRVTRERDEAQSTVRQATAAVRVAEMRAEAAEASLASYKEEVEMLRGAGRMMSRIGYINGPVGHGYYGPTKTVRVSVETADEWNRILAALDEALTKETPDAE